MTMKNNAKERFVEIVKSIGISTEDANKMANRMSQDELKKQLARIDTGRPGVSDLKALGIQLNTK